MTIDPKTSQQSYNIWFTTKFNEYFSLTEGSVNVAIVNQENVIIASIFHPETREKDIEISTYGLEITFCWKNFHSHFDSCSDMDHEDEFRKFKDFLHEFMNDRILIANGYNDGKFVFAACIENIEELSELKAKTIVLQSWSGAIDAEYQYR